jgi:DNA-binding beta-propeller fold protein YncE
LVNRKHIKQIPTGDYVRIHGAALAPGGRWAYFTAGQTGYVVEVDTRANAVTRGIPTHGKISHMVLVSPDGELLYTANISTENVSVINRATGELITLIPCGKGVEGMGITPDGCELWALNQEAGSVTVIALPAHEVRETFPCPGMPVRVVFAQDGRLALVPSWADKGELIVIETATRREVKRISVGSQAIGIVLSPDGTHAFVGCEHTDGVHVVDIETLSVTRKIMTGDGSDAMAIFHPPPSA